MTLPTLPPGASRRQLRKAVLRMRLEMHRQEVRHEVLQISEPECEFEFVDAPGYLMIAGGIGITPIYAMWKHLVKMNH